MDERLSSYLNGNLNLALSRPTREPKVAFRIAPKTKEEITEETNRERDTNLDYATKLKIKEENETLSRVLNEACDERLGIDQGEEFPEIPSANEVFERYEFELPITDLPIAKKRKEILQALEENRIIIIRAATGSGKSSQVPQYILEEAYRRKRNVNIVITQPRRISALTLADRVANERKCELGSLVGYQIGQDRMVAKNDTRILFCTTGVFLQKLVNEKSLSKWTHIIIDEIHERDLDLDFVLLVLRRIHNAHNSGSKIILMSATMETEHIANYFNVIQPPKVLELDVKRPFNTQVSYLDAFHEHQFFTLIGDVIDLEMPGIDSRLYSAGNEMIEFLIAKEVKSFLVFLPGWHEIETFRQELLRKPHIVNNYKIILLHSTMRTDNLKDLYNKTIDRKIVLATNVAESSITIPDIDFVIDYCLTKHLETDTSTNLTQLKLVYASKTNLIQREGRVGRTKQGQVIRMIFQRHYQELPNESPAEMQRSSLETVVLKAKRLNMGKPVDMLGLALSPPTRAAIHDAILVLKEIGALTRYNRDCFDHEDGDLTFVGNFMSQLPIDVRLARIIIFGYIFKVLNDAVIIASGLSVRSIFQQQNQQRIDAYETKFELGNGSSDCIAILNAYKKWRQFIDQLGDVDYYRKRELEMVFCDRLNLDLKSLNDMQKQIDDINTRLHRFKLTNEEQVTNENENIFLLKICIAGAFYPNIYIFGGKIPDRESFNTLNYKNPCSTVFYMGFPSECHKGDIYKNQIATHLYRNQIIESSSDVEITFDTNSKRVFVEFKNLRNDEQIKVPGDIRFDVYKVMRFCRLYGKKKLAVSVMNLAEEQEYLKRKARNTSADSGGAIYPKASTKIEGTITHIISPSKFYIQPQVGKVKLAMLEANIRRGGLQSIEDLNECIANDLILVKIWDRFYRAQIVQSPYDGKPLKVRLIDFGDVRSCAMEDLFTCKSARLESRKESLMEIFRVPPLCFEAKLAQCKPSVIYQTGWPSAATTKFEEIVASQAIEIDVYSFNNYDKVAAVFLRIRPNEVDRTTVNQLLTDHKFAQLSNESYIYMISKVTSEREVAAKNAHFDFNDYSDAPGGYKKIALKGPFTMLDAGAFEKTSMSYSESEVEVDPSSVNGILFDPYPYDGVRKVLIAASRSKNERGKVMLRQTTVMPHVVGMPSLLPLIFSPFVEMRCDKHFSRFTSILTGLGCSYDGQPYFVEHDNVFHTDVDIDNRDIELINDLRSTMSHLMDDFEQLSARDRSVLCDEAFTRLMMVMTRTRTQMGATRNDDYKWSGQNNVKADLSENAKMFPSLSPRHLMPLSLDRWKLLMNLNRELEKKARTNASNESLRCLLCEEQIETLVELKVHVHKAMHIKLAINLSKQNPNESHQVNKRLHCVPKEENNPYGEGSSSYKAKYPRNY